MSTTMSRGPARYPLRSSNLSLSLPPGIPTTSVSFTQNNNARSQRLTTSLGSAEFSSQNKPSSRFPPLSGVSRTKTTNIPRKQITSSAETSRSGKTRKEHDQAALFDQYDFYMNRISENSATLRDLAKKRGTKKRRKQSLAEVMSRRSAVKVSYSTNMASQRLKYWATSAYKERCKDAFKREFCTQSDHAPSDDSEADELLEELAPLRHTYKMAGARDRDKGGTTRRTSIFWAPPERKTHDKSHGFRWHADLIRCIVRLFLDMKCLSVAKTEKTTISEMLYISAGATTHAGQQGEGEEGKKVLFDKRWFSRNRARSRMPLWAEHLMSQPPNKRSAEQLNHLKQLLLTMKDFREKMTEDMRTKICQVVRYTKCDKGRVILRQGHVGFDFYFIFSGSVFIQIDIFNRKTEETVTSVENVLKAGECFGEIALLGDGKRTASVICKEPTELCQIDKATFLKVCPAMFKELLEEKIAFAQQFPLFKRIDPEVVNKICFLSQVLEVPHSTVIEKNWGETGYAYFVMTGRVTLLKEFDVTDIVDKLTDTRCLYDDDDGQPRVIKMNKSASSDKTLHTRFANCGILTKGGHTDLGVLSSDPRKGIERITVVSEGCRLFRVATRTFVRMTPRKPMEEYLRKVYQPMWFPSDEALYTHYLRSLRWKHYKTNMLKTCTPREEPYMSAAIPATHKGSTGWARWPGFVVKKKKHRAPEIVINTVAEDQGEVHERGDFYVIREEDEEDYFLSVDGSDDESFRESDDEDGKFFELPTRRRESRFFDHSVLDSLDDKSHQLVSDHSMTLVPPSTANYRGTSAVPDGSTPIPTIVLEDEDSKPN